MADELPSARTIGIIAKPISIKLAQAVGLTAAAFFAGHTATQTYTLLPALLQSPPALLASQFSTLTARDAPTRFPIPLACTALFAWLAAREPAFSTRSFRAYALAAALGPAALAYWYALVRPSEALIAARADTDALAQHASDASAARDAVGESTVFVHGVGSGSGASSPVTTATASPAASVRGVGGAERRSTFAEFVRLSVRRGGVQAQELSTHQLVDRWGWLNLGRAALGLGAALSAAWAVASEDLSFFELF